MGKIDIDISDSEPEKLKKDIIEILSKSDLEFSDDKLSIKLLTGGSSNVMYLVTIDSSLKSKLLFRIYGAGKELKATLNYIYITKVCASKSVYVCKSPCYLKVYSFACARFSL